MSMSNLRITFLLSENCFFKYPSGNFNYTGKPIVFLNILNFHKNLMILSETFVCGQITSLWKPQNII